jgi:hypothetical protein
MSNDKMYTFEREDGSGVSFDVGKPFAAEGKYAIVNLSAFDADGNDSPIGAFEAQFALDCFYNQCEPSAEWGN